jgi:hypothetical protein
VTNRLISGLSGAAFADRLVSCRAAQQKIEQIRDRHFEPDAPSRFLLGPRARVPVRHHSAAREENRVSELVRPISEGVCLLLHPPKHLAILKRTEQIVVAGAWFVGAGHDRVHAPERRGRTDALGRGPGAGPNAAVGTRRVFQRPITLPPRSRHASIYRAVDAGM